MKEIMLNVHPPSIDPRTRTTIISRNLMYSKSLWLMMINAKKIAPKPCKGIELIFLMLNCIKVMHMVMDENTLQDLIWTSHW